MKLVIISDTHTLHRQLEMPEGDVLIHCGDFCYKHDLFDNRKMLLDLAEWMEELDYGCKIVVAGNHDNILEKDPTSASYFKMHGINYLLDSGIEYEGVKFFGTPWQVPFWGSFNLPDESILKKLDSCHECDVFISHSPPATILDSNSLGRATGSYGILSAVERLEPKVHCFGHCHHTAPACVDIGETCFINAAVVGKDYKLVNPPTVYEI